MIVLLETFKFFFQCHLPDTKLFERAVISLDVSISVIPYYKFYSTTIKVDAAKSSYILNNLFAFS